MRYSANLNIIIKAIERAASHMPRDFIELENLQTNVFSANKFANSCYNRAKQILGEELLKARPDFNLEFLDGEKITNNKNAEYSYLVLPIDGMQNLARSNPDFTVAVALQHIDENGKKETISLAISKIFGGELYYCEKGFGAFLNSRRIRVSKRAMNDFPIISSFDSSLIEDKKFSYRSYGCLSLEVAYLAASRLEGAIFRNEEANFINPLLLLVKEAGGKIIENDKFILATNGLIKV